MMRAGCDMEKDCPNPVTHIGEKGYIYCAAHAPQRQGWERVRKMVPWELRLIRTGGQLPSYKLGRMPKRESAATRCARFWPE